MERTIKAFDTVSGQLSIIRFLRIFGMGIMCVLSYIFDAPSAVFAMDNGDTKRGAAKALIGGIVVHIEKRAAGHIKLLLDLTPLDASNRPLCQKPTGKLATVLAGKDFEAAHERSAFVVMPDPSDPLPSHLTVGDCLTVRGNDIDRVDPATGKDIEDSIEIVKTLKEKSVRMIQALSVTLWPDGLSLTSHHNLSLSKPSPAHNLHPL